MLLIAAILKIVLPAANYHFFVLLYDRFNKQDVLSLESMIINLLHGIYIIFCFMTIFQDMNMYR